MRTLLIVAFWMSQMTGIFAETHAHATPDCFTRLAQEARVADSVTVHTDDSTFVGGSRPIVNFTFSILHIRSVTDSGIASSAAIPFEKINRITYRKPSRARGIITLFGFGVGSVAGVVTVVALADKGASSFDFKSWDFDLIGVAFFGGIIGGLIGAAGGNAIGKSFTVKVTLECR
ncbi:MAG: hypothetical protein ABII79_07090 [bacterium]